MINNEKLDLTKTLNIQQNLKKSIIVTSGSSLIAAFLFFVAYLLIKSAWFLALAIILAVSGIAFYFVVKKIEEKYLGDIEKHDKGIIH